MGVQPGQRFDRYAIEELVGEGGMGRVYRAFDTRLQRSVAIKVLHPSGADAGDAVATALREARAAAAIAHPNATAVYDAHEVEGTSFIVMELVAGTSLRALIHGPSAPLPTRLRWLIDVAAALAAAHRMGVVHRDVKPENVMVRHDGLVKVLDFGVARCTVIEPPGGAAGPLDGASFPSGARIAGTPAYMSPEQIRGEGVDGRADQFGWGVTAYELLTGRLPWRTAKDVIGYIAAVVTEVPAPLTAFAPEIPPAVSAAILRALAKSPEDRFPSMLAAAAELAPYARTSLSMPLVDLLPLAAEAEAAAGALAEAAHAPVTREPPSPPVPAPPPARTLREAGVPSSQRGRAPPSGDDGGPARRGAGLYPGRAQGEAPPSSAAGSPRVPFSEARLRAPRPGHPAGPEPPPSNPRHPGHAGAEPPLSPRRSGEPPPGTLPSRPGHDPPLRPSQGSAPRPDARARGSAVPRAPASVPERVSTVPEPPASMPGRSGASGELLRSPDFEAHLDLDGHLAALPPDATCKGFFAIDVLQQVSRITLERDVVRAAQIPERRYVAFRDYPLADQLRLAVAAARLLYPRYALGEGLRRLGQTTFDAILATHVGRSIFGILGRDLEPILLAAPRALALMTNIGEVRVDKAAPRVFTLRARAFPAFLETYQIGVLEGVLRHCGARGRVRIALHDLGSATVEVSLM